MLMSYKISTFEYNTVHEEYREDIDSVSKMVGPQQVGPQQVGP